MHAGRIHTNKSSKNIFIEYYKSRMFNYIKRILVIYLAAISNLTTAFKICGSYCGENWCNGKDLSEYDCDTSVEVDKEVFRADECCMHHDRCCGHGDRTVCNDLLIKCIKEASVEKKQNNLITRISSALKAPDQDSLIDWFYNHFFDPLICGSGNSINDTYIIADFFESMNLISYFAGYKMCCGSIC